MNTLATASAFSTYSTLRSMPYFNPDIFPSIFTVFAVVATIPTLAGFGLFYIIQRSDKLDDGRRLGPILNFFVSFLAGTAIWWMFLSYNWFIRYPTAQVVACGIFAVITVVVIAWYAKGIWSGPFMTDIGFTLGISLMWALWAGSSDDTGLWGAGLVFMMGGVGFGLLFVVFIVSTVRSQLALKHQQPGENSQSPKPGTK